MNCLGSSSIYFSINHAPRGLFARNRERIGKGGLGGKKEERSGGFWQNRPSSSPSRFRTEREEGAAWPAGQGCPPAAPAAAATGEQGKTERGTRGFFPRAHLGLEGTVEAARRRAEGGGGANGGGAVVLGEQARECSISVRCGEVVVVPALNRRRRSVWGGGRFFFPARPPASSGFFSKSGRALAATGDATARAGTGQLVQES
jgi:hypothetical protein